MSTRDDDIRRGFDAGNYANAYETTCLETALAALSMNRSADYESAFILGFFGSYERHEMGEHAEDYALAYEAVGARAAELGIAVERLESDNDRGKPSVTELEQDADRLAWRHGR